LPTSQALFLIGPYGKGVQRLRDQVDPFGHSLMGAPAFSEAGTQVDALIDHGEHLFSHEPPNPHR